MSINVLPYIKQSRSNPRVWEVRENAAVRKLSPEQRAEIVAAVKRHNDRYHNRPFTPKKRNYEKLRLSLVKKEIAPIIEMLYRTPSSRWAGGNVYLEVKVGEPFATGGSHRAWSANGKWEGRDASFVVAVMVNWRRHVRDAGLAIIHNLLTTRAQEIEAPAGAPAGTTWWAASWIRQGRGFALHAESGVIVCDWNGEFMHAESVEKALRVLRQRYAAEQAAARRAELVAWLQAASDDEIIARYGEVVVRRSHSVKGGNCPEGTDQWIARHLPGRESITIAELTGVCGLGSHRMINAVVEAILDHGA